MSPTNGTTADPRRTAGPGSGPVIRWLEMMGACETGEVFALVEGVGGAAALGALFAAVREPWLTRALLQYHARTGSARALAALARAPEPHARHLLDALADQLREPAARRAALRALAPLLARRPVWLHRLPAHPLPRELLRAARHERHAPPLLHALLALAALLPAQPALAHAHWPELAGALLRPAAPAPPPAADHLLLARLALFRALYAAHPVSLLDALRADLAAAPPARGTPPRARCRRCWPPCGCTPRSSPARATRRPTPRGWRAWSCTTWWPRRAACRCRRTPRDATARRPRPRPRPRRPRPPCRSPARARTWRARPPRCARARSPALRRGLGAADAAAGLAGRRRAARGRRGGDAGEHAGRGVARAVPLPGRVGRGARHRAALAAAVAAAQGDVPAGRGRGRGRALRRAADAHGAGPRRAGGGGRVALAPRARLAGAVRGAPPPAGAPVARPEPRAAAPPDAADREVLELTTRARADDAWADCDDATALVARARLAEPRRLAPLPRRAGAAPPRPRAAPPRTRTSEIAVQTVDVWPEPYEFIIADFYKSLPDDFSKESEESSTPSSRLDNYLSALYSGEAGAGRRGRAGGGEAAEQLALVHAQLLYERWRREAHAERNRRLLGRCRQVRALELGAAALRDQLRAAARERDALRARLARDGPPALVAAPRADHEARLEPRWPRSGPRAPAPTPRCARSADARARRRVRRGAPRGGAGARRAGRRAARRARAAAAARAARAGGARGAAGGGRGGGRARGRGGARGRGRPAAGGGAAGGGARGRGGGGGAGGGRDARAAELEAALAARDAVLGELRRAARAAHEEGAARLRALQDKYEALQRVARAGEAHRLARLAAAEPAPAPAHAPAPAPAPR
ncbi:hypothetical protein MSG28_009093 [Choristoneura fumiferana]|uniref:Uncharacterized protein n=1 Tax=Choristoneura fumiferana TaxID=7141 RepID=A0ACC0KX47_CHOFU|nr:hypothetical protein MSG28_009093 [Choristoneura fumiferana]